MKLKTVIQLAKQAGLHLNAEGEIVTGQFDSIPRFAEIVEQHERENCAKVVEQYTGAWDDEGYALAAAIRNRT